MAAEEFKPEILTVEETIAPGANLLVLDQSSDGQSVVNVLAADKLTPKGLIGIGLEAQAALTADGKTLYTASLYRKRISYGPQEAVIHEYNLDTLGIVQEIIISEKMAMVEAQPTVFALTAEEEYLLVQNATPATSVSIVDLKAGAQIGEVPTPGCWAVIPADTGPRFSTLCGDGSIQTFAFGADGSYEKTRRGEQIFDVDEDALFANPVRVGSDLVFASFHGDLYRVTFSDGEAELLDTFSLTEEIEGDWAPGGSEVIAYHAESGIAFVLMHSDAEEGSHKNSAEEIWAVDLEEEKVLSRSEAHQENTITVSKSSPPVIYAADNDDGIVYRYIVDPDADYAAKLSGEMDSVGADIMLLITSE